MKGGTTSLWSYLQAHPDVFMSAQKELDFFYRGEKWRRGVQWYAAQFRDGSAAAATGEASPRYTKCHLVPDLPRRIAAVLPDARLVYCLRDPVERLRSHYLHRVDKDGRSLDPKAMLHSTNLLMTSRYAFQIECFLEHFDREQLLLITSERLRTQRAATMRQVYDFIGVDPTIALDLSVEHHRTADKTVDAEAFVLEDGIRQQLEAALHDDVARLRAYMDEDFDGWGIA